MFEYLFPIFAFGVVITGIVCKGLLFAADVAKAEQAAEERPRSSTGSRSDRRVFIPPSAAVAQTNHA